MKTPGDVAEMLRLKAYGWGSKRIGWAMGYSHRTVGHCVLVGGAASFKAPKRRKLLDCHQDRLGERFIRHSGGVDVVRQDLLLEGGLQVSRRSLQRAVQPHWQAVRTEAVGKAWLQAGRGFCGEQACRHHACSSVERRELRSGCRRDRLSSPRPRASGDLP